MGAGLKRSGNGRRHRPMGEINVTPFVDVMLVLLIVFMVTAPLLTVGVEVDLPKTQAGQINADAAPLVVSIKDDGTLYLQETEMPPDQLIPRLQAISNAVSRSRLTILLTGSVRGLWELPPSKLESRRWMMRHGSRITGSGLASRQITCLLY